VSDLQKQRVDKWLYHARFFKTRTLAAAEASTGHLRINSQKITKPAATVQVGDVLTFHAGGRLHIVEVLGLGTRRGPAPEAQALYEDQSPTPPPKEQRSKNPGFDGKGRPTKRDRRKHDLSRKSLLE